MALMIFYMCSFCLYFVMKNYYTLLNYEADTVRVRQFWFISNSRDTRSGTTHEP